MQTIKTLEFDLDMESSAILLGQWVATVAAYYQPELPKPKSTGDLHVPPCTQTFLDKAADKYF